MKRVSVVCALLLAGACAHARAEGLALRMEVQGSGERTVVFEAGLGDTFEVWQRVQAKIAFKCARTCRIRAPGIRAARVRRKTSGMRERSSRSCARRFTTAASLRHTCWLGIRWAGLYMQYFARNHPEEVAGTGAG